MVVSSSISTTPHRDDPSRLRHLVINLAESRGHLVGESASDNHTIGLARAGPENDAEAIKIVTGGAGVHHFDSAASKTEGHRPDGTPASPVEEIVNLGDHVLRGLGKTGRGGGGWGWGPSIWRRRGSAGI